jgi:hypothetical protein
MVELARGQRWASTALSEEGVTDEEMCDPVITHG